MKKFVLLLLLAVPVIVKAQDLAANADGLLSTYAKNNQFSGNVLIAKGGKIVFSKAYGYADKEHNRLNNLQTEFRAGSLTKMFTATLILQLAEQRKLSLTDKLDKYVPGFPGGKGITIKNLLSHTSGIRGNTSPGASSLSAMINGFKAEPQAFAPGERFEYNNFNFLLLAYIAQKITATSYPLLVKRNVFDKAGMLHSGIDHKGRKSANAALGYMVDEKTNDLARMETGDIDAASGAGALYTTVEDLLKWSAAIDAHNVLSAESFKLAFTPVQPGYGLGFIIGNEGGHQRIGHTGSIEGFMADFAKFGEDNTTVIFLSNLLPPVDVHLERALTAIAFNQPFQIESGKKEVTIAADELPKFAGTYEMDGQKMVVSVKDGKLFVLAPMGDTVELAPEGGNKFFVKGPQIGVEFIQENGKVTAMNLDMRGGQKFKRVE